MFFSYCNMSRSQALPTSWMKCEEKFICRVLSHRHLSAQRFCILVLDFARMCAPLRNIVHFVSHTENAWLYAFASDKWRKTWAAATQNKMTAQKILRAYRLTFRALVCVFELKHTVRTNTHQSSDVCVDRTVNFWDLLLHHSVSIVLTCSDFNLVVVIDFLCRFFAVLCVCVLRMFFPISIFRF